MTGGHNCCFHSMLVVGLSGQIVNRPKLGPEEAGYGWSYYSCTYLT